MAVQDHPGADHDTGRALTSHPHGVPGPAPFGTFVRGIGLDKHRGAEWVAPISAHADVIVGDADGAPSPIGVAKALSIVQSRAYLQRRAVQLLIPLTRDAGSWRLVTIDFGAQARLHACEFLMCFAFEATHSELSITSPYAEIGFALTVSATDDPLFVLTVKTASGFSGERHEVCRACAPSHRYANRPSG